MIKSTRIRILSAALASLFLVCSCTKYEEIPELIEPVDGIQTYRPVTKMNVGKPKVLFGSVTAEEYCHFYKKPIEIESIEAELGQYVNEGDVLVKADVESVKVQINDLNNQIALLDVENEQNRIIHESKLEELELQKNWTEYLKNLGQRSQKDVEAAEKNIENENENYDYDVKMYEFMRKSYTESLSELNEIVTDGTLKAKHSGYVTYVKNLKNGHEAKMYENVVIVSDYDDLYIQGNITTQSYQYSKYDAKFVMIDGNPVPITEYEYTEAEKAYAKAQNSFPTVRFKPTDDTEITLGENCVMLFYKEYAENVLAVGLDSTEIDEDGSFVYVKCADGSLEKRYFEMGVSDSYYHEVLSGIEEGELVLYEQTAQLPKMTDTWQAERSDYDKFYSAKGYKHEQKDAETYSCDISGEVDTLYVEKGDEVKAGDPLAKIKIDADKGDNVKITNDINHLKIDYEEQCRQYDKDKEELEKQIREQNEQIDNLRAQLNGINSQIDSGLLPAEEEALARQNKAEIEFTINSLACSADPYGGLGTAALEEERKILEANKTIADKNYQISLSSLQNKLNEQKKTNDGSGYKIITALKDGVVETVKVSEGDEVDANEKIMTVANEYDDYVVFTLKNVNLQVGFETTISGKDNVYNAVVLKDSWDLNPNVFTENDKVYSTYCIEEKVYSSMKADEELFVNNQNDFEANVKISSYKDEMIVPHDFIFSEKDFEGAESFFVWKLENGEAVKEYVVIEDGISSYAVLQGVSDGDILVK